MLILSKVSCFLELREGSGLIHFRVCFDLCCSHQKPGGQECKKRKEFKFCQFTAIWFQDPGSKNGFLRNVKKLPGLSTVVVNET